MLQLKKSEHCEQLEKLLTSFGETGLRELGIEYKTDFHLDGSFDIYTEGGYKTNDDGTLWELEFPAVESRIVEGELKYNLLFDPFNSDELFDMGYGELTDELTKLSQSGKIPNFHHR